ncbi:MAG: right-handed parallel beta-helix repeat-containing protein, partial [Phycisphaerales bacterium]
GDYSYTTLDPVEELTIWTIQEYGHADEIWGTWVGVLTSADCNGNQVDDYQDIAEGTSDDCNANNVPDECEPNEDCNGNSVQDICDMAGVTSSDCNANKVPDECDISAGTSADDNGNNVADECEAARLYVDGSATGLEQGTTWANAYTDLQDALDIAALPGSAATEIWVAAGTYLPTRLISSDPRSAAFLLVDDVTLLGGFAGDETFVEQRDPGVRETILSGDLGQNDGSGVMDDNAYHVVIAQGVGSTAVLDGFVITAGRADAAGDPNDRGGGFLCDNASPTILGCVFRQNHAADRGGGFMVKEVSGPVLNACVFQSNTADGRGGGLFNSGSGTATIVNGLFTGNSAVYGGGMANAGVPDVICCSFSGNTASTWGGGIYSYTSDAVLTVTNSILWGNSDGGGTDESAQVHVASGNTAITYDCIQGWSSPGVDGNVDTDPQFVDANGDDDVFGTADDNLRLTAGSGCIDAGDNAAVPSGVVSDLDGRLRLRDGDGDQIAIVDMGAYEYMSPASGCICGDINGSGGLVDLNDFSLFALCFGQSGAGGDCSEQAFACSDLDASGSVNLSDFSTFAVLFGVTSSSEVPACLD